MLWTIDRDIGDLGNSVPVAITFVRQLRRLPLGQIRSGEEIFAFFFVLEPQDFDASRHHVGRSVFCICTQDELEQFVSENELELQLED